MGGIEGEGTVGEWGRRRRGERSQGGKRKERAKREKKEKERLHWIQGGAAKKSQVLVASNG